MLCLLFCFQGDIQYLWIVPGAAAAYDYCVPDCKEQRGADSGRENERENEYVRIYCFDF